MTTAVLINLAAAAINLPFALAGSVVNGVCLGTSLGIALMCLADGYIRAHNR